MVCIILALTAAVCAVNWIKWRISTFAMIYYMKTKGYELPSEQEMKSCCKKSVLKLFG